MLNENSIKLSHPTKNKKDKQTNNNRKTRRELQTKRPFPGQRVRQRSRLTTKSYGEKEGEEKNKTKKD